jgi:hypothetical protein
MVETLLTTEVIGLFITFHFNTFMYLQVIAINTCPFDWYFLSIPCPFVPGEPGFAAVGIEN